MTSLIFIKLFKSVYIVLIDYFSFIAGRPFKYLFSGIFIICKHFFKLLLFIFAVNLYADNVSFNVHIKLLTTRFH